MSLRVKEGSEERPTTGVQGWSETKFAKEEIFGLNFKRWLSGKQMRSHVEQREKAFWAEGEIRNEKVQRV